MPRFEPERLQEWTEGRWTRLPSSAPDSVTQDTRSLRPGGLYVALPGERVDGHDFLTAAREAGAAAALCARGRGLADFPCLEVDDPASALIRMAAGHRARLGGLFIGVTGSAGKTTVKDLIAAMLGQRSDTCHTPGNWNNAIGLPLSLLRMEETDNFGVFELGMNQPGEIAALTSLLRPLCGTVTSVGEAHLEQLGSVEAIAHEKGALLRGLPVHGLAVMDADSPWRERLAQGCAARQVTVSSLQRADYLAQPDPEGPDWLRIEDRVRGGVLRLRPPLPGKHMRTNVLLAVALARELGLHAEEIEAGLREFRASPMRWQVQKVGGREVINDAYNANPLSMRASIRTFSELEPEAGKWLVLGGMGELGPDEASLHRALGEFISDLPLNGVLLVGAKAGWIGEGIRGLPTLRAADAREAARLIRAQLPVSTRLLFKASRAEALEKVIDALAAQEEGNP